MSRYELAIVPPEAWSAPDARDNPFGSCEALARDVTTSARRAGKGAPSRNYGRIDRALAALEMRAAEAVAAADPQGAAGPLARGEAVRLAVGELPDEAMSDAWDAQQSELLRGFEAPGADVAASIHRWQQVRGGAVVVEALSVAAEHGCGVVWLTDCFASTGGFAGVLPARAREGIDVDPASVPAREPPQVLRDMGKGSEYAAFWSALRADAANGLPIAVGKVADAVLTEALRDLAALPPQAPLSLRYGDGSLGPAVPICGLGDASDAGVEGPTSVTGLMSLRHPENDPSVHSYWFRNQELSTGRADAAMADLATERAMGDLAQLPQATRVLVHVSGFRPAIVGLWRAVCPGTAKPGTVVVPTYIDRGTKVAGRPWPAAGDTDA